jgi:protein gp37
MSKDTEISWCDSSLNLMMGCDGCELFNRAKGVKHCYAGEITDKWTMSGAKLVKGYPRKFEEPALFLERLEPALKWSDLTGKDRPEKPWLNGLPRMIFLNDMGDTFTESLPLDWLAPLLPRMADSPHIWMLLTKRGGRMLEFSRRHPLPVNVWPGVSVTTQATARRVESLLCVQGGGVKWISAEPLRSPVEFLPGVMETIGWCVIGGESGRGATPCEMDDIAALMRQCDASEVPTFIKQFGSNAVNLGTPLNLKEPKGGDPSEWPAEFRVRQMPKVKVMA